jgi:hypothetical protein
MNIATRDCVSVARVASLNSNALSSFTRDNYRWFYIRRRRA